MQYRLLYSESARNQKYFFVPRQEIVDEKYDLSLSRYKEEVFEEIEYEKPGVIPEKLLASPSTHSLNWIATPCLTRLRGNDC